MNIYLILTYLTILLSSTVHSRSQDHKHPNKHRSHHAKDESRSKLHPLRKKQEAPITSPVPDQPITTPQFVTPADVSVTTSQSYATTQASATTVPPSAPQEVSTTEASNEASTTTTAPVVIYASTEAYESIGSGSGMESESGSGFVIATHLTEATTAASSPPVMTTMSVVTTAPPIPAGPSEKLTPQGLTVPTTASVPFTPEVTPLLLQAPDQVNPIMTTLSPQPAPMEPIDPPQQSMPPMIRTKTNSGKHKSHSIGKKGASKRKLHAKVDHSKSLHHAKSHSSGHSKKSKKPHHHH